jgi:hypothetical protein
VEQVGGISNEEFATLNKSLHRSALLETAGRFVVSNEPAANKPSDDGTCCRCCALSLQWRD